ncbi:intein-containing DNA polymerase delta catalytic subunit precursor [Anaeramoeba flamelloides]|uniref:DNA polymerase delta catalytic subunit n=1 Tax=Anaeramoeba flamelloides TaxID=1746091 RepID=A0AAV8AGI5_9EUKA|nr:intein-containing DNA polymerase delta catalytic subunit precursor [Anaeramoeba flamelloides]
MSQRFVDLTKKKRKEERSKEVIHELTKEDLKKRKYKWKRPVVPSIDPKKDTISFMHLEIDRYTGEPMKGMPVPKLGQVPIIRIYGITMNGNSVMAHIHGFTPYFYIQAPSGFTENDLPNFEDALNIRLGNDIKQNNLKNMIYIRRVEIVQKESVYGYKEGGKQPFLKIFTSFPKHVPIARKILSGGFSFPKFGTRYYQTYESNILFALRFMIDVDIYGGCWLEARPHTYRLRSENYKISRCQIEFDIGWDELVSHPISGEWQKVAPLRILSFDIECSGRKGHFPEPEIDPVIQIANVVTYRGSTSSSTKEKEKEEEKEKGKEKEGIKEIEKKEVLKQKRSFTEMDMDPNYKQEEEKEEQGLTKSGDLKKGEKMEMEMEIEMENNDNKKKKKKKDIKIEIIKEPKFKTVPPQSTFSTKKIGEADYTEKHVANEKSVIKNVFTLKSCLNIPGAEILPFKKESDLLSGWCEFVQEIDPDIIIGYNTINFDVPYLINRSRALKIPNFVYLGRIKNQRSSVIDRTKTAKSYGKRVTKETFIPGRCQMDLLPIIRESYKLSSYKLNSVSLKFLGEQKDDVHFSIISDLQNGNAETRRRLALYCLRDSELPLKLLDKLMIIVNYVEMARVTGVPLNYLLTSGQQIKVVSQLYRKANSKGYVIPYLPVQPSDKKYTGAIVIEPKKGFYQDPIVTLDFSSLYPSIMIAHNLCYTTLINPEEIKNYKPKDYVKSPNGDHFIKPHVRKGILPEILNGLLQARKVAKGFLKKEKDPFKKSVYNARQLALKISANSVYGFTGATIGRLPCLPISSSVTSFGREMIDQTKKLVEEKYNTGNGLDHDSVVVYGDSVVSDTPIIIKKSNNTNKKTKFSIVSIKELFESGHQSKYTGWFKEFKNTKDLKEKSVFEENIKYVWSDNGWNQIIKVIRHKCKKKIYRIVTESSCVEVTQDHSLLDVNGKLLKPENCKPGTKLLKDFPKDFSSNYNYSSAEQMDNNNADFYFNKLKNIKINNKYRLKGSNLSLNNTMEKIPNELFQMNIYDQIAFLRGYLDSQKISNLANFNLKFSNKTESTKIYCILKKIGYDIDLGIIKNYNNELDTKEKIKQIQIILNCSFKKLNITSSSSKNSNIVKSIECLGYIDDFVYDIETQKGTFLGGIGSIVLKNTDSVMINFGNIPLNNAMELGKQAATYITSTFVKPINLEYEKVYFPYLLISKKRYAGLMYTGPEKYDKIDSKGIELVRRDNCPLVKNVIGTSLNKILIDRNVSSAVQYVQRMVSDLLRNKLDISQLVITKGLTKKREEYAVKMAHAELAYKLKKRDPGSAPQVGDRVPYVILKGVKGSCNSDNAEDPLYTLNHGLAIDTNYYLEKQLSKPIIRIYKHIVKNPQTLLKGKHTRSINIATPSKKSGGIMRFAKIRKTCLCNKVPLTKNSSFVCKKCENHVSEMYQDKLNMIYELENEYSRLWTQCQKCQRSIHLEVLCSNSECPIFYRRMKVRKDLQEANKKLKKFDLLDW